MDLIPINLKSNDMAIKNCIYLPIKYAKDPNATVHVKVKGQIIKAMFSQIIDSTNFGASKSLREYLSLDLVHAIKVQPAEPLKKEKHAISLLKIDLIIRKNPQNITDISEDTAVAYLRDTETNTIFNTKQPFYVKIGSVICEGTVVNLLVNKKQAEYGIFVAETQVDIISGFRKNSSVNQPKASVVNEKKVKEESSDDNQIFKKQFNAKEMGIGGLDDQLFNIFRRTFASRRFSNEIIDRFGVKHVKGILLYGPPGTGKTLIARQLAKVLDIKPDNLKIINGPQVFSKFVGESEENIRKLFSKAREDENKHGPKSPLHIIVFDEIDAICKQRGVYSGGTNVNDQVVNQLLSVIDGVDALNNIIVIGMTNRKDLIDEAILRPGRFEVHVEVSLPNAEGRQQILNIHTSKLQANKLLHSDCKMDEMAQLTRNYTGAEIQALIKCAASYAITRSTNVMDFSQKLKIDESKLRVEKQDFLKALEQVKPQFGIDEDKFASYFREKVINFGGSYEQNVNNLSQATRFGQGSMSQIKSALLYGPSGSGKTTIAVNYAKHCSFPYVKIISPENFVGHSDSSKIHAINKIFDDAYKTKKACIVIDNIQRLIEYTAVGKRFSNAVLQTLLVLISKIPPSADSKLLIVGTTSIIDHMERLGIPDCFTNKLEIPNLNAAEISSLLEQKCGVDGSKGEKIGKKLRGASIRNILEVSGLVSDANNVDEWTEYYKMLIDVDEEQGEY